MSSSKKGHGADPGQMFFNMLIAATRMFIRYIGRFFTQLLRNIIWLFAEAPGANNDFSDYCRTNFGSAPATWVKVCVGILLSPLVLTALIFWSALRAI